jgi:hypothetical protein
MPLIIASVELVDVNNPDYEELHRKMRDEAGFFRSVRYGDRTINFVHAQYGRVTDETDKTTAVQYCEAAKTAASKVHHKNRVNISIVRLVADFAFVEAAA